MRKNDSLRVKKENDQIFNNDLFKGRNSTEILKKFSLCWKDSTGIKALSWHVADSCSIIMWSFHEKYQKGLGKIQNRWAQTAPHLPTDPKFPRITGNGPWSPWISLETPVKKKISLCNKPNLVQFSTMLL